MRNLFFSSKLVEKRVVNLVVKLLTFVEVLIRAMPYKFEIYTVKIKGLARKCFLEIRSLVAIVKNFIFLYKKLVGLILLGYLLVFMGGVCDRRYFIQYCFWERGAVRLELGLYIDFVRIVFRGTVCVIGARVLVYCY